MYFCPLSWRCDIRLSANRGEKRDVIADEEKIFSSFGVKAVADRWHCVVPLREGRSQIGTHRRPPPRSPHFSIRETVSGGTCVK